MSTESGSKAPVAIWPDGPPRPLAPYTPAIKAAGWLFISGQLASDFKGGLAPEAASANPNLGNALELQSRYTLANLAKTVQAGGCDIAKDAVRIWQWFTSPYPTMEEFKAGSTWPRISITPYLDTRNEFIKEPRPASTGMGIRELLVKDTIVEVDLICIDDGGKSQGFPTPEGVPSPLAGYSPAIRRGDWIFMAGEIPVDWTGDYMSPVHLGEPSGLAKEARINPYFWYGSEIEKQTEYVLWKLAKTAEAAGTTLDRSVKADVYIGDPSDYAGMEKVWKRWFPKNPPARCVIPYMGLGGKGSKVEVALTLLAGDSKLKAETIKTEQGAQAVQPRAASREGRQFALSSASNCHATRRACCLPECSATRIFPITGLPARHRCVTCSKTSRQSVRRLAPPSRMLYGGPVSTTPASASPS